MPPVFDRLGRVQLRGTQLGASLRHPQLVEEFHTAMPDCPAPCPWGHPPRSSSVLVAHPRLRSGVPTKHSHAAHAHVKFCSVFVL